MPSKNTAVLWIGRLVVVLEVTDVGPPFSALVPGTIGWIWMHYSFSFGACLLTSDLVLCGAEQIIGIRSEIVEEWKEMMHRVPQDHADGIRKVCLNKQVEAWGQGPPLGSANRRGPLMKAFSRRVVLVLVADDASR